MLMSQKQSRCLTQNTQNLSIDQQTVEEVESRICKAGLAFGQLKSIWNSSCISTPTNFNMFNSCVKSILLYAYTINRDRNSTIIHKSMLSENTQNILAKANISSRQLGAITGHTYIHKTINRKKCRWIGHMLRRPHGDITRSYIEWNPQGSRRRGRPRHTWIRQLVIEVTKAGKSWNETKPKELKTWSLDRKLVSRQDVSFENSNV